MLDFIISPYHLAYINILLVIIVTALLLIYKYIFPKKNINFVFLIIIISIVASWSVFREGTYQSGDLRVHTAQLISFYHNLQQGNFIPIWAGELCGGYGCPVLQFFYTLPYYIASIFHFLGFTYLTSLKILIAGSFLASGITMYFYAKAEFGKKAGLIGAIFYLFAPYHLIDFHFRGGIGEVLSFVFIPLIFLFTKKIIETNHLKYFLSLIITAALLLMSHSSTTAVIIPLSIIYGFVIWRLKKKKNIKEFLFFILAFVFGFLIISFYWIPALLEVKYTWYGLWIVGDFRPILEYIYSPARYGFLYQGNHGEYRLIIGYFHLLAIIVGIVLLFKEKIEKKLKPLMIFLFLSFFALFFMMLEISKPIWESIHFLNTFLMVWRLLIPIAFITSAAAALVAIKIRSNLILGVVCFLVISITILNWGNRSMVDLPNNLFYNEVENYTEYVDPKNEAYIQKYISHAQIKNLIVTSSEALEIPIKFISGSGEFKQIQRSIKKHLYIINVNTDGVLRENTYYYPGWAVYIDNKKTKINYNNEYGVITFNVSKGIHKVDVVLEDTLVRFLSKLISLASFTFLVIFTVFFIKRISIRKK